MQHGKLRSVLGKLGILGLYILFLLVQLNLKYTLLNATGTSIASVAGNDLNNTKSCKYISFKDHKISVSQLRLNDGVITQRNISAGALVGPGSKSNDQPMLVLQHLQKLRLEVYIPEAYVDQVNLKKPVSFVLNSMPENIHQAKISRSANTLTNMRSEAIEIDIQNKKQKLKPGMYAEVKVPLLSEAKSLLIPNNAIIRSTERQYVITVKNGKTSFIDIKEGLKTKDSTEVFGELTGGDEILLHATDEIKEGTVIK